MRIIDIPPYRAGGVNYDPEKGHYIVREIVDRMRRRGQLDGIEFDIDEGHPTEHRGESRDEEILASITPGFLQRVRAASESGKYDAIVTSGAIEPGFFAGRMISRVPIAFCVHAAVHVASLIGERFSFVQAHDPGAQIVRRVVEQYGFGHKLASVRCIPPAPSAPAHLVRRFGAQHGREDRMAVPEVRALVERIVAAAVTAIEEDRVDSVILGGPYFEMLEEEVRGALDRAGYEEIPLVCELASAVEMAKSMVNMGIKQSARAYPSDALRAKPRFR